MKTIKSNPLAAAVSVMLVIAAAQLQAGEKILVSVGTQDTTINCAAGGPVVRELHLLENLEAAFSRLQVLDIKGVEVDKKDPRISGATMTVSLPKLPAGTYRVSWQAVVTVLTEPLAASISRSNRQET